MADRLVAERLVAASDLPTVAAVADTVSAAADGLRSSTARAAQAGRDAASAWGGVGVAMRSPGVTERLPSALHTVPTTTRALADGGGAVATALETFAEAVGGVRRTRSRLLADIEELHTRIRREAIGDGSVPAEYAVLNEELLDDARRLRRRWRTAQDDLAAAFRAHTSGGGQASDGFQLPGAASVPVLLRRIDFGATVARFDSLARLPLLAALASHGRGAIARWRRTHPDAWASIMADPPSTRTVSAWWGALDAGQQEALALGASVFIGNLDGVAYFDRGVANEHSVRVRLRRYEELRRSLAVHAHSAAEAEEYSRLSAMAPALQALSDTLEHGSNRAHRTIVSLTLGRPVLAAVAIGNMDTARNITVAIPGMGATVAGGMVGWAGATTNLLRAQRAAALSVHTDPDVATVAWIGYDTPAAAPDLTEVLSSAKAKTGAEHLATFLRGVSGTRHWSGGENLSVVAHSYGTTTATLAVQHTPVANLTLLASAGIDTSLPDVHAIDVPASHVWASQAKADHTANLGRGAIDVDVPDRLADRGSASGHMTIQDFRVPHPLDPGTPAWGARTFSSDDAVIEGVLYPGATAHDATFGTSSEDHGYLDADTAPLRNTAYTSLGYTPDGKPIP
ncbi:alpha/beta hydrolase [Curtobacterium sp. Leaf261]|uniref:alpha/beta hydrolase n=1 Tax=Curtobacterium sp. Leaf261 TaxID=1736311 RepID=UPI0006F296B2|nr:alpha/beta hydrolase [Curtobacterium sp. Leaf261]KQO63056.1 hypothetical protein ASF23_09290 [Curtobacterium sp. Leaf261]